MGSPGKGLVAVLWVMGLVGCSDGTTGELISEDQLGLTWPLTSGADVRIYEGQPNQNSTAECSARGDSGSSNGLSCLMRWFIPATKPGFRMIVNVATLDVRVLNSSPQPYEMRRMVADWSETEATWLNSQNGQPWQVPGAKGTLDRSDNHVLSVFATSTGAKQISIPRYWVQEWVDNPSQNRGIIFSHPTNTDGISFATKEHTNPSYRPTLVLDYFVGTVD